MSTKRSLYMTREVVLRISGGKANPVMIGAELFTDDWVEAEQRMNELNEDYRATGKSHRFIHTTLSTSIDEDAIPW